MSIITILFLENFGKIAVISTLISVVVLIFFKLHKQKINISTRKKLFETNDYKIIGITNFGILDRGSEFNFCKFIVDEKNTLSLYFRHNFPKDIYYGPFVISQNSNIYNFNYKIHCFERNEKMNETYLSFSTKPKFINGYKITIENLKTEDFILLRNRME